MIQGLNNLNFQPGNPPSDEQDGSDRAARRSLSYLLSFTFVYMFARGLTIPVIPLYLLSLHFSALDIGVAAIAFGAGTLIFEPLYGVIADRTEARFTVDLLIVISVATYIAFTLTSTLQALVILQFGLGGVLACVAVILRTVASRVSPAERLTRGFGYLGFFVSGAITTGSLCGGILASLSGFHLPFYLSGTLAGISYVFLRIPRLSDIVFLRTRKSAHMGSFSQTGTKAEIIIAGAVAMTIFAGMSCFTSLMPVVVSQRPLGADVIQVSIMIGLLNLSITAFQPLFGAVGKSRPYPWILGGLILGSITFISLTSVAELSLVFVISCLVGISFAAVSPLTLSIFTNLVHANYRGTAIGVYGAAEDVGQVLGPFMFTALWTSWGLSASYMGLAALYAIAVLSLLRVSRRRMRLETSP